MSSHRVFRKKKYNIISNDKAEIYLKKAESGELEEFVNSQPAYRPKAGELLLFKCKSVRDDTYARDQYSFWKWRTTEPKGTNVQRTLWKLHAGNRRFTKGFTRYSFKLITPQERNHQFVLVQYVGDETVFKDDLVHGNSKSSVRPFTTTSRCVLEKLAKKVKEENPKKLYQKAVKKTLDLLIEEKREELEPVLAPRDTKQIRNIKYSVSIKERISVCEIFSLFELAKQDFHDSIHEIKLIPSPLIIFSHPSAVNLAKRVLKNSNKDTSLEQLICVDTTFNCADSYLTALVVRNTELEGDPIFPVIFMFHETKTKGTHRSFWFVVNDLLKIEKLNNIPIATDRESAIVNSLKELISSSQIVFCHNHIISDVKNWLYKSGQAKPDDFKALLNHMELLLSSDSPENFALSYSKCSEKWTESFKQYFDKNLLKDIENHAAKFVTSKFAAFASKVPTNNLSESLNRQIKDEIQKKELPLDSLFIALYQMQTNYILEFNRAFKGLGDYKVKLSTASSKEHREIPLDEDYRNISDVIHGIKEITPDPIKKIKADPHYRMTPIYLASLVIENGLISFDPPSHTFIIRPPAIGPNSKEKNIMVNINKSGQFVCQCNSSGLCYHILAAMQTLRIDVTQVDDNRSYKLTTIEKKSRGKEGKSGKKRPRSRDIELQVEPADDSLIMKKVQMSSTPIKKITAPDIETYIELKSHDSDKDFGPINNVANLQVAESNDKSALPNQSGSTVYDCLDDKNWMSNFAIEDYCIGLINEHNVGSCVLFVPFYISRAHANREFSLSAPFFARHAALNHDMLLVLLGSDNNSIESAAHWMLGIIHYKEKQLILLDSLKFDIDSKPKVDKCFAIIGSMAAMTFAIAKVEFNLSEWTAVYAEDMPKQTNGYDCGLFVCMVCNSITTIELFSAISCEESREYRRRIKEHLLKMDPSTFEQTTVVDVDEKGEILSLQSAWKNFEVSFYYPKSIELLPVADILRATMMESLRDLTLCGADCCCSLIQLSPERSQLSDQNPDLSSALNDTKRKYILCVQCRLWYHEECIDLSNYMFEGNIPLYFICENCATTQDVCE